jgi:hypothetical protein
MQHRPIQRIQRFIRIVLLRQRDARAVAEALAGCEILEVEAVALPVAVLADAVVGREQGASPCNALSEPA